MATIPLSEAEKRLPGFIDSRPSEVPWVLTVTTPAGTHVFNGADWIARSERFGSVYNTVVVDRDGKPLFERPAYEEAPNVNVIAWGKRNGEAYFAILHEARPHAHNPLDSAAAEPMLFGQIPMGFIEKIMGKQGRELGQAGAIREVAEETGASAVLGVTRPAFPFHNPNPTFVATWSELFFVEVDLDKIGKLRLERGELIYKAEYIPARELLRRIAAGTHEGAVYRACTSLSLFMVFFATYPQYFPR